MLVLPPDGATDVAPCSDVLLLFDRPIDPVSATGDTVMVTVNGEKIDGKVTASADRMAVRVDPSAGLAPGTAHVVSVTAGLVDITNGAATPFQSSFSTSSNPLVLQLDAGTIGAEGGGTSVGGENAEDNAGFSAAAVGDVNDDGVADLLVGAPNVDVGAVADAGQARLIFGSTDLQSSGPTILDLDYQGDTAQTFVGKSVAAAGDPNNDMIPDFLVGAPDSDVAGVDSGEVFLVFGDPGLLPLAGTDLDLAGAPACGAQTLCGVRFTGAVAGELAGFSVAAAGDVNDDGVDDVLIGAPGASPAGRDGAGQVYLIYGPLSPGTIDLSTVGGTTPGLIFHGEDAGHRLGESVAPWPDDADGIDDILLGAPGATALDFNGTQIDEAGYLYAIYGGTANLDDSASPGVIETSRVANDGADEVLGVVVIGTDPNGRIGRSVTGEFDYDGDGVFDLMLAGNGIAFALPGDGPKSRSGVTTTKQKDLPGGGLLRDVSAPSIGDFFGAVTIHAGADGAIGALDVASGGDVNNDGYDDLLIGAPSADPGGLVDAGRLYILFGRPVFPTGEIALSDVGTTEPGLVVDGAEAGDQLGSAVSGGVDLNGDGVDDALVGAPYADASGALPQDAGVTYVVSPVLPEEVVQLRLDPYGPDTLIEWSVPDQAASYNVYRGSIALILTERGVHTASWVQLDCGIATNHDADMLPDTLDDELPLPNEIFTYLVTANNALGESTLGTRGMAPARINDGACP
ncbi:MAG: Ig-like domain-containing protein [Gemmatimonadales bacterium]